MRFALGFVLITLFLCGATIAQKKHAVQRIDTIPLEFFRGEPPNYIINKKYVVYERGKERKILHPDMASFKLFSGDQQNFAIDKHGIYYRGKLMRIDTAGIRFISSREGKFIWKTNRKIFRDDVELQGVDAATFRTKDGYSGKDRNGFYFMDGETFKKIPVVDTATFRPFALFDEYGIIEGYGSYDKYNVYDKDTIATYRNEQLKPVNDALVKTSKRVLFRGERIRKMDAATIRGLSPHIAIDKAHIYNDTSIVDVPIPPERFNDVKVWDQVNSLIISDGVHVYDLKRDDLSHMDAQSFGMIPNTDSWYDKNGIYSYYNHMDRMGPLILKYPFKYSPSVQNTKARQIGGCMVYDHQAYNIEADTLYENVSDEQLHQLETKKPWMLYGKGPVKWITSFIFISDNKVYNRTYHFSYYSYHIDIKPLTQIDAASVINVESTWPYSNRFLRDRNHVYYFDKELNVELFNGPDPASFRYFTGGFYLDKHYIYTWDRQKLISSSKVQLLAVYTGKRFFADEGDGPPSSDYCLFKNSEGYWLIETLPKPKIYYLGRQFNRKWNKAFLSLYLPKEVND